MDKILFNREQLKERVDALANQIAKDYNGKELCLVGVLNGAYMFCSDLSKSLWDNDMKRLTVEFIKISSYGSERKSNKKPELESELQLDIKGKHVLIVEDIVETGLTMQHLISHLKAKLPLSVTVCALLSKPNRKVSFEPEYLGWKIDPTYWVEGYGMDSAFMGRGRPYIVRK